MDKTAYDIFISYAREDLEWVRENLYLPLSRCRTRDGRRPRIFFDVGDEGIAIGVSFIDAICDAIERSEKVIPVYSVNYFREGKEGCVYELAKAHETDLLGKKWKLVPILKDPEAKGQVPFTVSHLNYWPVASPDWFERLCKALEVIPSAERLSLAFLDQPPDVVANHTLPPIRVMVQDTTGGPVQAQEEVRIEAEDGGIQGTTSALTDRGIAVFEDLSMGVAGVHTRLVASGEGLETTRSETFFVLAPRAGPGAGVSDDSAVALPASGEAVFFSAGDAVAVMGPDRMTVWGLDGEPILGHPGIPLSARLRIVHRSGSLMAVADWRGGVHVIAADGSRDSWSLSASVDTPAIPGDIAIDGEAVYVGMWDGRLYKLTLGTDPSQELLHLGGIQSLATVEGQFFLADFTGRLCSYRAGNQIGQTELESLLWFVKPVPGSLMVAGEKGVYHVPIDSLLPLAEDLHIGEVVAAFDDTELPMLIDAMGRGIRIDEELNVRAAFHTAPGAVPVSSDHRGELGVFLNPDGSRTLLVPGKDGPHRILFSHANGTLAVSPAGDRVALGDGSSVRILDQRQLERLIQEAPGA